MTIIENTHIFIEFIEIRLLFFFLLGDGLSSPADGNKSRSLPRVTCQQEDAGRWLNQKFRVNGSKTMPWKKRCVGLTQFINRGLIPESKHHKKCVSTFQSLGLVHEAYDLSKVVSVYNVRCCGIISVEEFGS